MDRSKYLHIAGQYFYYLKKSCYGLEYLKNKQVDGEFSMKLSTILDNLSSAFFNFTTFKKDNGYHETVDVINFSFDGCAVIKGLLYGDISKARSFVDVHNKPENNNPETLEKAIYLNYCLEKESRSFIEFPSNYSSTFCTGSITNTVDHKVTETSSVQTVKQPCSSAIDDVFSMFNTRLVANL